ncbi:MAG: hypothetical protein WC784_05175 [Candidatus Shapirobacteria bacterium]|jgi:hypothetical protein
MLEAYVYDIDQVTQHHDIGCQQGRLIGRHAIVLDSIDDRGEHDPIQNGGTDGQKRGAYVDEPAVLIVYFREEQQTDDYDEHHIVDDKHVPRFIRLYFRKKRERAEYNYRDQKKRQEYIRENDRQPDLVESFYDDERDEGNGAYAKRGDISHIKLFGVYSYGFHEIYRQEDENHSPQTAEGGPQYCFSGALDKIGE